MASRAHARRRMARRHSPLRCAIFALLIGGWSAVMAAGARQPTGQTATAAASASIAPRALFDQYCVTCHNQRLRTAGLALDTLDPTNPGANATIWERVIEKLRAG